MSAEESCAAGGSIKVDDDIKAAESRDEILFKQPESSVEITCCASCGVAGGDDIKLKDCTACHLVKYCGIECQRSHWRQHKKECKKRAAELRDEILFKQPESSHYGDCPICCLPLSLIMENRGFMTCCCKMICTGCCHAYQRREKEGRLGHKCPFCRQTLPKSPEDMKINLMKRLEANDPFALCHLGVTHCKEGDYKKAFQYWTKAAELDDIDAHYNLSIMYRDGQGVEKDTKKELYHLEKAAIGGHADARYNLGQFEGNSKRSDRAIKHWIIAANMGHDESLELLKKNYASGYVSKDDFAAALRGHHAAVKATKSPEREEEEAVRQKRAEREASRAARRK